MSETERMNKPLVLKQRFRLGWFKAILLVALVAILARSFARDPTASLIILPAIILTNFYTFFPRTILGSNCITVCQSLVCGDLHRFERIVSYLLVPEQDSVKVQVALEQRARQAVELFGQTLWQSSKEPRSSRKRTVSFSVEPEQSEMVLDYLRAQGAVLDEAALIDWKQTQIIAASGRELRRLGKAGAKVNEDEVKKLLAELEAKLLETEKTP